MRDDILAAFLGLAIAFLAGFAGLPGWLLDVAAPDHALSPR